MEPIFYVNLFRIKSNCLTSSILIGLISEESCLIINTNCFWKFVSLMISGINFPDKRLYAEPFLRKQSGDGKICGAWDMLSCFQRPQWWKVLIDNDSRLLFVLVCACSSRCIAVAICSYTDDSMWFGGNNCDPFRCIDLLSITFNIPACPSSNRHQDRKR